MARTILTTPANLADVLKDLSNEFYTKHVQEMAKTTIRKAPVRTGELRGSIHVSKNAPRVETGELDPSGTRASSRAEQVQINIDETAFVTAGAEHAGIVEQGSSTQAPQGYMRTTVAEAQQIANRVARDI